MKKCKYHCDYGDGENCHYKGPGNCANDMQSSKQSKKKTTRPFEMHVTVDQAIDALKSSGWTECTYNGITFAMVCNKLVCTDD